MPSFPIIGWPSWEPPAPSEGPPGPPGPAGAAGPTGRRGYGTALQAVYEFVGSDPSPETGALWKLKTATSLAKVREAAADLETALTAKGIT